MNQQTLFRYFSSSSLTSSSTSSNTIIPSLSESEPTSRIDPCDSLSPSISREEPENEPDSNSENASTVPTLSIDPSDSLSPSISREEHHRLISRGPCQPRNLNFPVTEVGGQNRSFQPKWYDLSCCKHWLEYFEKKNALFCFSCRFFGAAGGLGKSNERGWRENGVQGASWKNALQRIRKHSARHYHISSMDSWKSYLE